VSDLLVVESLPVWLPLTSPWLHQQILQLPEGITVRIVAERVENLDAFSHPNLRSLQDGKQLRYVWDKGTRRLGLRDHLGLVASTCRRERAGVLHSHWGDWGWRDRGVSRRLGIPQVVTYYGKDVSFLPRRDPVWRERYADLFRTVGRVLCEGPHMAERIVDLGCDPGRVAVHHLGVDVSAIEYRPRAWTPSVTLKVLIAASFREKKGIPLALEALGRLAADVDLRVTIIGDASADPRSVVEKDRILTAAEPLGPRVAFLGYQSLGRLFEEAYAHHVFVSPSLTAADGDTEGGAPVSLIDMAATGMPIVSSTHCDIPSVVLHGKTGLLASEGDVDGVESNLRWLIEHPSAWETLVEAGRRHVEAEYDSRRLGRRLGEIYQEVAG